MAENLNLKTIDTVDTRPFKKLVMTIGELPTSFVESMTYYELLAWFVNYLETVIIPTVNNNAEVVKELQDLFVELRKFVDEYFDNLDVQEEINNKLDEMVADGTFGRLLGGYIITEITTVAYYDETSKTKYWVTHVPHTDSKGELIEMKVGLANDNNTIDLSADETARSFAKRHDATLCVTGSVFNNNDSSLPSYMHPIGPVIKDGVLISNYDRSPTSTAPHNILGIMEDNTLKVYPFNTEPTVLIADGVKNAITAFDEIMSDGVITDRYDTSSSNINIWNFIGQNTTTKDIYFFQCEGRNIFGAEGMSVRRGCEILKEHGCDFAYRLDGGGSTSLCLNSVRLNQPVDGAGTEERPTPTYLYFGKPAITSFDKATAESNRLLSDSALDAMVAKASHTYMQDIESTVVNFKNGGVYYPARVGLHFTYFQDDAAYFALTLCASGHDKQVTLYDNTTSTTVGEFDPINKSIILYGNEGSPFRLLANDANNRTQISAEGRQLLFEADKLRVSSGGTDAIQINAATNRIIFNGSKTTPDIFEYITAKESTEDYNNMTKTGFYYMRYNASQANVPFAKPGFLIVMAYSSNLVMQIAFPGGTATGIQPAFRCKNDATTWTAWQSF